MRALQSVGGWAIKPNSDVLRRKLRSDQADPEEQTVSPVKAARMSLARAADQAFKLALRVGGIRQSRLDLAEMVEQLDDDWALFPVVHDDGSVGVMCLDPSSIVAFVEQQTLGKVGKPTGDMRKMTRTDKALALPFLERFLRLFDEALEGAPTAYWTRGYRAEDAVETRHLMVLLLDASEYRGFEMHSDVDGGNRSSAIRLFLPIKDPSRNAALRSAKSSRQSPQEAKPKLRNAALAAVVEMDAVMCKVTLPLSELSALKPGQLLALPKNAAQHAQLQDKVGQTSPPVHLGQLHGMRAVRLMQSRSLAAQGEIVAQNINDARDSKRTPKTEKPMEQGKSVATSDASHPSSDTAAVQDELDDLLSTGK
ncbi:MAG: FliM/FliN family flagellar motor C-terminal domain-containing protein [Planktotalea sp.]|uniref:hypothetical protein n=1 Tax=Planktotalea sp. TaxID=2029877 RepID=UPI003C7817DA